MVEEEFKSIAGFSLPPVYINRIEENVLRKDGLFQRLSDLYYEDPFIFSKLLSSIEKWKEDDKSDRVLSLAGYLYYIAEDYEKASSNFLLCISQKPENLDFWMDLAFSLYHLEDPLGYSIIFNYDLFIHFYKELGYRECTFLCLAEIDKKIRENNLELSQDFRRFLVR